VLVLILVASAGVSGFFLGLITQSPTRTSQGPGGLKVLATFFPVYYDSIDVLGTKGNVTLLVPFSVDVHQFEPTPSAVLALQSADVLVFNGAGLEPWIPSIVAAAGNSKLVLINASQGIPLIQVPQQYQKGNRTIDPHVWIDPILAQSQVNNILQGLIKADLGDASYFTANANALNARFQFMDQELKAGTASVATRTFISFHEAFGYLAKEYNLVQVSIGGPFDEEPTPTEISNAVAAINQNHLCVAFAESLENPAPVDAVASQTHAHVWILDPKEGLSASDVNAGVTYVVKMQVDIYALLQSLNQANC
jgi:zinc transport system substrate-binding protein